MDFYSREIFVSALDKKMKVFVKSKPKSKNEKIEKINKGNYAVFVKESPEKGKANKAILRLLAKHFGVSVSQLEIVSGAGSRNKIIKIL